jgi:Mg-chelatase subunit ChlD
MKPEQITAWALNEASAEDRQQLEAALLENPKDKLKAEETKAFCDFLLKELRDESLAFTEEQRERLVGQASRLPDPPASETPALQPPAPRTTRWNIGVIVRLAVAACVVLGGVWTWHSGAASRQEVRQQVAAVDEIGVKVNLPRAEDSRRKSGVESATRQSVKNAALDKQTAAVGGELSPPAAVAGAEAAPASSPVVLSKSQVAMSLVDVAKLKQIQDQKAYGLDFDGNGKKSLPIIGTLVSDSREDKQPVQANALGFGSLGNGATTIAAARNTSAGQAGTASAKVVGGAAMTRTGSVALSPTIPPSSAPPEYALKGAGELGWTVSQRGTGLSGAPVIQSGAALSPPVSLVMNPEPDARYYGSTAGVDLPAAKTAKKKEADAFQVVSTGESYTRIIENEMKEVAREPLSTFSIDVDTASYANVRRFLNQNMIPPPDAVRIEELVNYFPTSEEGPAHGSKVPFGVRIELAPCPWQPVHRLARIAIKGREMDKNRKASNLVFLVDVSGSMNEPAKLPLVQQSLRMLTEQLGEGDRVTMVVYAGSSGVVLPPTSGEKKSEILAAIDKLSAGGSTHGSAGIKLAYEQAVAGFIKGGVNRVILCTDGDFNVGVSSPEELEKLIKHQAKTGVFLSVLGFGSGNLKDRTMETLADKGNGNYAYIDSLSEARKVLVEQMSGTLETIAKDVKIQVEFNPALVRSYRLIGYENRLLAKEDFNDDTKDAGEIGAGHSVVALYEIVPASLPAGEEARPVVDSLKYQTAVMPMPAAQLAEAAKSGEVMTVKLRYKEPESSLSKLIEVPVKDAGKTLTASSDEYKFSAAVAGFGLLLRDSGYKGNLSWETVRRLAIDGKGADKLGYRGEFLQLIDKARGLKEMQR